MKILDRYLATAMLTGVSISLLVLLAIFGFLDFIFELKNVGRGDYGVWQAILYVTLSMVSKAYLYFPIAALIGCITGLGALASHSELVAMRAAGLSLRRIIWTVLRVGLAIVLLATLVGETLAPLAESYATRMRSDAISGELHSQGKEGLWARDGNRFVKIETVITLEHLGPVTIYEVDSHNQLIQITSAKEAIYDKSAWRLLDVEMQYFINGTVERVHVPEQKWGSLITPEKLDVLNISPETKSVRDLYDYVGYLKNNGLSSARYEMALWTKLMLPFVILVMMTLAVPFVFGPLRSVGIGQRILVGVLVGLGFYLLSQMVNYVGLVHEYNPAISALVPVLLFTGLSVWLLKRIY
ncbi:MAG: LPS export ABC transporter permease LptG [Pseudomonadota bacterium]